MQGEVDEWAAETQRADRMFEEVPTMLGNRFQVGAEGARVLGRLDEAEEIFRKAIEF